MKRYWWIFALVAILGIIPSVIGLVQLVTMFVGHEILYGENRQPFVEEHLDELRRNGLPIDNPTLEEWYSKATSDRDKEAWKTVFSRMESEKIVRWSEGAPLLNAQVPETIVFQTESSESLAAQQLLDQSKGLREEIHHLAASRTPVRFPFQFEGVETLYVELRMIDQVSQLLALEHACAHLSKDSATIRRSVQTRLNLKRIIDHVPGLISSLLRTRFHTSAMQGLSLALVEDSLTSEDLDLLAKSLQAEPLELDAFRENIQLERGICLPVFSDLHRYGASIFPEGEILKLPRKASYNDMANYLEIMQSLEACDPNDYRALCELCEQIEGRLAEIAKLRDLVGMYHLYKDWRITSLFLPSMRFYATRIGEEKNAHVRTLYALQLRRFQNGYGQFPDQLSELKKIGFLPESHTVVGNQPIGYQRRGDEAILWTADLQKEIDTPLHAPAFAGSGVENNGEATNWIRLK